MIGSLIINRDKNFSISRHRDSPQHRSLLDHSDDHDSDLEDSDPDLGSSQTLSISSSSTVNSSSLGSRNCFCCNVKTPDTSPFRHNLHSQFLQKFPFLIEMFYWALNYAVYSVTKILAEDFYDGKGNGIVELAQSHGISILKFEHESWARVFFPIPEVDLQRFFLVNGHTSLMTILNRAYSLVHIPGTVL